MAPPWNILVVEDSENDYLVVERYLGKSGRLGTCRRVDSPEGIDAAAREGHWDVVLCDYSLPGMDFNDALSHLRGHFPETPVILVSGHLDLEAAVDLLKLGIADFVLKGSLARLVPCIERGLKDAAARTAQQEAEAQLQESRRFAQLSLDALSAHIAVLDSDGTILAVNRAWREFAAANGVAAGDVCEGANYLAACAEGGAEGRAMAALIGDVIAGRRAEGDLEYACHSPEEERWFRCQVTRFSGGGPVRVVAAHEEITGIKRAEEHLRVREEQLAGQRNALISLTGAAMLSWDDIQIAFRRFTETAARTLDVGRASLWRFDAERTAIQCLDLYETTRCEHGSGLELSSEDYPSYFRALEGADIIDADDVYADPRTREFARDYFPAYGITSMLDAPIHFGGTLHGVLCCEHTGPMREWSSNEKTFALALANLVSLALEEWERTQVEDQLRLHSAALAAASNGIVITESDGTIIWANPAFSQNTGYTLEEAVGRKPGELLNSGTHDAAFFEKLWNSILAGEVWRGMIVNRRKDGSLYSEAQTISPIRDGERAITHFVAIKEDVTEKLRAEKRLEEARERLQRAVHAGNIALWEWDLQSGAAEYSPEWLAQAGLAAGEISGTPGDWLDRVHEDDLGPLRQTLKDAEENPGTWYQKEFRLRCGDGGERWILMGASADTGEEGQAARLIGANIDITDRKRLEAEFNQAQKMESIGRLAGGVAHDFNNLLGVIGGYAEFALESLKEGDPLRGDVEQIHLAAKRAGTLVSQLLAFSRRQILQPEVICINDTVTDVQKMLGRLIGEDIEIVLALDPNLGRVMADPGQMEQILMNLSVNARDAMPKGGRLTLSTTNRSVDEVEASQRPGTHPGEFVCLAVSDNGSGMDRRTRERIFDPFFTTKAKGKGTGLGLATVYGIVKQSGGNIWVYSEPGEGTVFRIYLPRVFSAGIDEAPDPPEGIVGGAEAILLVEDEDSLRAVTQMILTRVGYTVHTAADGEHAIALMAEHGPAVALVLTDVVMPGVSGPDMATQLRANNPKLKVVFMSGYTDDTIVHHGVLDTDVEFINKPFTFAQLTRKIRDVLDRP